LVEGFDVDLCTTHQILTSVRLDGVDEPAFRAEDVCARSLASFSRIEVDTGEPSLLARQSLADAAMALSELAQAAKLVADGFRRADVSPAVQGLQLVTQNLLTVFQVIAAASVPLTDDFGALGQQGLSIADLSAELDGHTKELIEAQQSGDWVQLADILEYDLEPLLTRWRDVLMRVATA
jgi:hypothetical protein